MVSHRVINDIIQTPKKEVHFFFFSICGIVSNFSWQLIMFDKKQKGCVKRIHLVTDDGLNDRKAFYTVKIVFYLSSMNDGEFINYQKSCYRQNWINFYFIQKALYLNTFSQLFLKESCSSSLCVEIWKLCLLSYFPKQNLGNMRISKLKTVLKLHFMTWNN